MSLRLERIHGAPLVGAALTVAVTVAVTVALAAAMLALLPAAAGAQTEDTRTPSVMVRPGDSLWSISQERLGPDATPQRVADAAEQIHALNRARIGADPNLILVGQELLVPPAMSETPIGAAVSARKADPPRGPAGKEDPRRAPRQGSISRSEISLEELDMMLVADTKVKENLPNPRAAAPVPAVRTVASRDAQPRSFFGFPADVGAEGRRLLLGLGIMALTLVAASLIAAHGLGYFRGGARNRDLWFKERYGRPYAAFEPLAGSEDAPGRVPEARDRTAYSDDPTTEGTVPEDRFDITNPFVLARVKRARVRRQSPRPRPRGLRRPVRATAQGRPSSGRPTARARREEWEPGASLVRSLEGLPLRPGTSPSENLAGLEPHLEKALGALKRLERLRGLSQREKTRREALMALMALMATVERGE